MDLSSANSLALRLEAWDGQNKMLVAKHSALPAAIMKAIFIALRLTVTIQDSIQQRQGIEPLPSSIICSL